TAWTWKSTGSEGAKLRREVSITPSGEGERGLTLLEVVVALLISVLVMTASLMLFRKTLLDSRQKMAEKEVLAEATELLDFVERHLSLSQVNDLPGRWRMHFLGEEHRVKFIAPFSPGEGSDLAKFGLYLDGQVVKVSVMRVDRDNPDFVLPEGFSGAQPVARNILSLSFLYFDGQKWRSSWDTREEEMLVRLPLQVKVTVVVQSSSRVEGRRLTREFSRTFKLEQTPDTEEKTISFRSFTAAGGS
ncbi:MAG TPA: hypothetical protein PKW42_01395, partial [bacterium]|nr:hypothetical protein [bacterium]